MNYLKQLSALDRLLESPVFEFIIIRYYKVPIPAIIEALKTKFKRPLTTIDKKTIHNISLLQYCRQHTDQAIIITDFDSWLTKDHTSPNPDRFVLNLNSQRDLIAKTKIILIGLLPQTYSGRPGQIIPDLWEYRSLIIDVDKPIDKIDKNINKTLSLNQISEYSSLGGKTSANKQRFAQELETRLQNLPENADANGLRINYLSQLIDVYSDLGLFNRTLDYGLKYVSLLEQNTPSNHADLATGYNDLGAALDHLGDYKKAIEYYEKALKINLNILGENNPNVAIGYNNLGLAWDDLNDSKKAIEYYEKALKIDLNIFGQNHPNVAREYNNLGFAWSNLGDYKKAIEYYEKALKIDLNILDQNHPNIAIGYNNLGLAWDNLGDYKKAIKYYEKALKIFQQALGNNHPSTQTVKNNIEKLKQNNTYYE